MNKKIILNYITQVILSAFVLSLASVVFEGIYIENVLYAIIGSMLLILFNATIKPFFKFLMLPFNILTFGFFTPLVDVIILKIIGLFLGTHFMVNGWLSVFFASIFISIATFLLDKLILGGRL